MSAASISRTLSKAVQRTSLPYLQQRNFTAAGGVAKATLIPGDGVGPELCNVVQDVFKALSVPVDFEEYRISELDSRSDPLEDVVESIKKNMICLKGNLASQEFNTSGELKTLNMKLREELDLFANVVHVKSLPGIECDHVRHDNIDIVVIREQTEGEYSALEHESVPGVVESLKITTRVKCERIAKFAFDYATRHGRKRVTAVHKANIMKIGDGLFLESCQEIAKLYPHIKHDNIIIDNCAMQLVSNPQQFDVMVMPNLYGNIVDNLASGLVGGAGIVPGASFARDCVVFEQGARHTFSEAIGKNIANPTAMLLCSANMLNHIGLNSYGDQIRNAVESVIQEGKVKTRDIGGYSKTLEFTTAIINKLHA